MPHTLLFSINHEGRIYALSTGYSVWKEFQYLGLEFKKLSAVQHFLWAIGGDRQVYVHVFGLDIPIRVKEESYENERWFPIEGFGGRLLPTDRPKYSNWDGTESRSIDSIRLPSMAWQWESDWQLECTLNGEPLDHDGWTYAIDFPATFYTKKSWNSCVRRRKWFRYRRYAALSSWCAVAPLHKDPTQEPFVDVAIGGNAMPGADHSDESLSVWAITAHGRVMYRTGVSTKSPEGQRWTAISIPSGAEINQISVGPTGLTWSVLYSGKALVRTGIRRETPTGENWCEVTAPGDGLRIVQVSVGTNAVWCVTNDNHVWFRRGIKGEIAGISEEAATGNAWIEMVGNISHVSVAANDQVFAVGSEDRNLYFRTGVNTSDLTGKKWRQIQCPLQFSRASSTASLNSRRSESPTQSYRSITSLHKEKARVETSAIIENVSVDKSFYSTQPSEFHHGKHNDPWLHKQTAPVGSLNEKPHVSRYHVQLSEQTASSAPMCENVSEVTGKYFETPLKNPRAWSPVRSVGSIVGTEAHPESDSAVFETDSNRGSCFFGDDDDQSNAQCWTDSDSIWTICSAGAVNVEPQQLPNWFKDSMTIETTIELTKEWRLKLIEKLKNRLNNFEIDQSKYERAIESSSWVKSGEAKASKGNEPFSDCLIELEWLMSASTIAGTGTLTILNPDGVTMKMQLTLTEILCVACCSEPGVPRLTIYRRDVPSLRLQFESEKDYDDWMSELTSACCDLNEVSGKPAPDSIWTTTVLGDVFSFDPVNLKAAQFRANRKLYEYEVDMLACETPYQTRLFNGISVGSELEITGCIFDDADQVRFDLQCHSILRTRFVVEKMRQIACHINPRFNEKVMVLNTMENSEWMDEIRTKNVVFSPGNEFKLIVRCETAGLNIEVDGIQLYLYKHRIAPEAVHGLFVSGRVKLYKVKHSSPKVIIPIQDMFWRQIGGHLKKVASSKCGIVWGIGYDNTARVYTNGWGGSFLKTMSATQTGINTITDICNYYIYENQRWNPLSGYTSHGLPTDRYMWSDASGKQKRSKENTKLFSSQWQWISDWIIDFNTPGGVDRDGWQYAVDFPASYHAKKQFTDYVRRRRWYRKCRLTTSGPWHEVGNTRIIDVCLQPQGDDAEYPIKVWAIASNGDALLRSGVNQSSFAGIAWQHITSHHALLSIGASQTYGIWAIGRNGSAYRRCHVTADNPLGEAWQTIDPPQGSMLKSISVGSAGIWAIDTRGQMVIRREITDAFPEGSHWQVLPNVVNDPPHEEGKIGFKSVSVTDEVWSVSVSGCVCKRSGVTKDNPAGTGWMLGISANFSCIS